jgi:sulfur-oxidizing protein SoxA
VKRLAVALAAGVVLVAHAQERAIAPADLRSGITFSGANVRVMQEDDAANPAYLWVERGERLWNTAAGPGSKSCASCHHGIATMRGVAARYPMIDAGSGALLDLPARIGDWHARTQGTAALKPESEDLLALTAYVALQSRGMPVDVSIDGPARAPFERARAFYYERHGQMNLSCAQCHEQNWGRRLYNELISQGHGTAFPAYRLEWQALGSLDRRLRACLFGIRAEVPPPGSKELTELALFLAWRAQGLKLEAPGVRR